MKKTRLSLLALLASTLTASTHAFFPLEQGEAVVSCGTNTGALYVVGITNHRISKISIERLSVAVLPFLGAMIIAVLFLVFVPQLSLALLSLKG